MQGRGNGINLVEVGRLATSQRNRNKALCAGGHRGVQKHPKLYKVIIGTAIGAMLYIYIFEKYIGNIELVANYNMNVFNNKTIEELNIAKQFAKEILPIINDQD